MECREEARKVTVEEKVRRYIIELAVSTRQAAELVLGASPRAEVLLLQAATRPADRTATALRARPFLESREREGLTPGDPPSALGDRR